MQGGLVLLLQSPQHHQLPPPHLIVESLKLEVHVVNAICTPWNFVYTCSCDIHSSQISMPSGHLNQTTK